MSWLRSSRHTPADSDFEFNYFGPVSSTTSPREDGRLVWHNPNPHQMAETLKVVMLTHASDQPVPIQYNSCILHVLDSYHDMRQALVAKDQEIEELQRIETKNNLEFQEQLLLWRKKEEDYKAELKRMEVMLARGERGLDLVTLARTDSALRRENITFRTSSSENTAQHDNYGQSQESDQIMTADFAERRDADASVAVKALELIDKENRNYPDLVYRHRSQQLMPLMSMLSMTKSKDPQHRFRENKPVTKPQSGTPQRLFDQTKDDRAEDVASRVDEKQHFSSTLKGTGRRTTSTKDLSLPGPAVLHANDAAHIRLPLSNTQVMTPDPTRYSSMLGDDGIHHTVPGVGKTRDQPHFVFSQNQKTDKSSTAGSENNLDRTELQSEEEDNAKINETGGQRLRKSSDGDEFSIRASLASIRGANGSTVLDDGLNPRHGQIALATSAAKHAVANNLQKTRLR